MLHNSDQFQCIFKTQADLKSTEFWERLDVSYWLWAAESEKNGGLDEIFSQTYRRKSSLRLVSFSSGKKKPNQNQNNKQTANKANTQQQQRKPPPPTKTQNAWLNTQVSFAHSLNFNKIVYNTSQYLKCALLFPSL